MSRLLRIGIDTGGTFTDVVAVDEATGEIFTTKTPSTPHDPSVGVLDGISKILRLVDHARGELRPRRLRLPRHHRGDQRAPRGALPGLGLVTTQGFRHVLEIARQAVPRGYGNSYFWVKPDRIVPLHLVREVPERLNFRGEVLRAFDEAAAAEVARWFRDNGIDSIGVSFIHAYANPEHEQRMRAVLERRASRRARVDLLRGAAGVPGVRAHGDDARGRVREVARVRLRGRHPGAPGHRARAGRAVLRDEVERRRDFGARGRARSRSRRSSSGPAAGALGASLLARAAGFDRVLTADAGGTSTDVCLVEHGVPGLTTDGAVGRFPVKVPMIDIVTVGAGGGSIAWIAPDGGLKVGPRSAGADPGPLCYGRGGDRADGDGRAPAAGSHSAALAGRRNPARRRAGAQGDRGARGASRPRAALARPRASSRSRPGIRPTPSSRCRSSEDSIRATTRSWPSAAPVPCWPGGSWISCACARR